MAKIFREVIDADGNKTYEEVEISALDVREHPEYRKVLEEQIKTRKKLAEARKATSDEDVSGDTPTPEPKPETPKTVIPTVDDVLAELEKRQKAKHDQEVAQQTTWNNSIEAAMSKHKLPSSARTVLENARDPEAMAEALAKSKLTFADTPAGGDIDPQKELNDVFAKIDERMGFAEKKK